MTVTPALASAPAPTRPSTPPSTPPATGGFFGRSSLPADPAARRLERRGRRMLVVSYLVCPCHLPVTMTLLGFAFGGTAVGSALAGNAGVVGVVLGAVYAFVLWRAFRSLRRARRLAGPGGRIDCSGDRCEVVPQGR